MAFSYTIEAQVSLSAGVRMWIGSWNAASATSGNIDIPDGKIIPKSTQITDHTTGDDGPDVDDITTAGRVALTSITQDDVGSFVIFTTG